jgi:hypothetical protein
MRAWRRHAAALPGQSLSVGSAVLAMPTDDLTPMARHLGGGQAATGTAGRTLSAACECVSAGGDALTALPRHLALVLSPGRSGCGLPD